MSRQQDNIAGVYDPAVILTQKGGLLAHNGIVPVEVSPGAADEFIYYDPTSPTGLNSRPIDPAAQNITNAANQYLFRLGM